jgi:hypothetical protein
MVSKLMESEFAGDGTSTNGENGEHKDSMIDERMSEGTGLISNEFQVEVRYKRELDLTLWLTNRSNSQIYKPIPTLPYTVSRRSRSCPCELADHPVDRKLISQSP